MAGADHLRQLEDAAAGAIRRAFASGDPPGLAEMASDHCPECIDTNALFAGKRWDEITVADLRGNPGVSLMTPAALRYYLPALMLRCIEAPIELDSLPYAVVDTLSPPNGKPNARLADLQRSLTRAQADAVVAFLRVFEARDKMEHYPEEAFEHAPAAKVLTRALEYWSGTES